jgi:Flp pilus assembly protein TadD
LRAKGDVTRALADLGEAIRLAPMDATAYNSRAWTYQLAGRDAEGLADANKAIELNPVDANAFDTRGTILVKLGKRDKAAADFRKALELNPGLTASSEALKKLGVAR